MTEVHRSERRRLLPNLPLPPYAHVPGLTPHPIRDVQGHSHGVESEPPEAISTSRWRESAPYLRGIDLFNYGYYWEAHEVWESLWHVSGRVGTEADFLKGLIKLAAAAVKVREGVPNGAKKHARRARELFQSVAMKKSPSEQFLGFAFRELIELAERLERLLTDSADSAGSIRATGSAGFPLPLELQPLDPNRATNRWPTRDGMP
ncbi:MAG: DUF309 domain-containing protein [Planctomycetota bacterium]